MVGLVGEVIVERTNAGDLSGPGGGVEAVFRAAAVGVEDPVTAEVGHVAVDIREGHRGDKIQIHVGDVDLVQRLAGEGRVTALLQVAEEISQVQIVFIHRALRVGFDGLVVRQKIPKDRRRFGTVIRCHS